MRARVKAVMRTCLSPLAISYLALLLVACGSRLSIHTSYDHSIAFEKYHTYVLDVIPAELAPISKQTLEETLRSHLTDRGLEEVSADQANLLVISRVATERKQVASPMGGRVYFRSNFCKAKVNTEEKNAAAIELVVTKVVAAIPRLGKQ